MVLETDNIVIENVTGVLERITYYNEENGFAVLKLKIKPKAELVTVIGNVININVGEYLECHGNWVNNKTHGIQFKATQIKNITPTSIEGIEKYLGSGLIKGIGPGFAKRLIRAFNTEVFEIIENQPEKLATVEGIGDKRKEKIINSWQSQKKIREIIMFLHKYGLGTTRAVRIYKTYGENAISEIRENPYSLVTNIHGIGFKTADALAIKLGLPKSSLIRIRAGVRYLLQEFSSNGHCAAKTEILIEKTIDLLEVERDFVLEAINLEIAEQQLVPDLIDNKQVLFLAGLYNAEQSVAKYLQNLKTGQTKWKNLNLAEEIENIEKKNNINLSASQKTALQTAINNKVIIITGGPGVGKTTLIKSILTIIHKKANKALLCAPTGRAAKKLSESTGIEAKTIHRLLEIELSTYKFKHNQNNPLDCELLVVDEVSMIDLLMMNNLLKAIPKHSSLILAGDIDQLPSVGPGAILEDLIKSKTIPTIELTEIFRQSANSKIITNAHRINKGFFPKIEHSNEKEITDFYFIEENEPEIIQQKLISIVTNRIPERFNLCAKQQIQILSPMTKGALGTNSLNQILQKSFANPNNNTTITRYGITFSLGDKVIQTINNYDKDVFNGDIGFIKSIDLEEGVIIINFDNKDIEYELDELDEISLAYAITIHKSQGSEYPAVVMPITMQHFMLLERNLIYTGITRAKKLVVIIGQIKALAMAIKNKKSNQRLTNLIERLTVI